MRPVETLPPRIHSKIQVPEDPDACWTWGACVSPAGYGRVRWEGVTREAHRVVYALLREPIPAAMVLDHLCHDPNVCTRKGRECPHRRCVNPMHLKAVTVAANNLRSLAPPALNAQSDRCDNGHLYVTGSFRMENGSRRCLICRREKDQRRRPRGVPRKDRAAVREFRAAGETPERRARDAEIVRLRDSGMTFHAIAAELGISHSFASARYNRTTGSDPTSAKLSGRDARQTRVRELAATGMAPGEIAATLQVSRVTVFRDLETSRVDYRADWPPARIREFRTTLGLSQRELAERLEVTWSAVSLWERGRSNISWFIAARLQALASERAL